MKRTETSAPKTGLVAALVLLVAACSPMTGDAGEKPAAEDAAPAVHPVSGLPVVSLAITSHGKVHTFRVEVASTFEQQERGLMFRTEMGADEGMIFPMKPPRPAAFWMKNTVIPLDIVYIGPGHRISNIAANAVPYDLSPLYSKGPVVGVLELNGGRAAQLGIAAGDTVNW